MNKTKKDLLAVGSIITIITSVLAIIASLFMFFMVAIIDEKIFVEMYKEEENFTYYEDAEGDYYLSGIEDGKEIIISEDEIEDLVEICQIVTVALAVLNLSLTIVRLIFAVRILKGNCRDKNLNSWIITLIVLSMLQMNILESVFFLIALCVKDQFGNREKPLGLNDILIEEDQISKE